MTAPKDQPRVLSYVTPPPKPPRGFDWWVLTICGWILAVDGGAGVVLGAASLGYLALHRPPGIALGFAQELFFRMKLSAAALVIMLVGLAMLWWRTKRRAHAPFVPQKTSNE